MIDRIRRQREWNVGRSRGADRSRASETDLSLDHQLTFSPHAGEQWKFNGRDILWNGEEVEDLIEENSRDAGILTGVCHGLDAYRQFVWSRGGAHNERFNGRVDGLMSKVHGCLGKLYDGLTGGVSLELEEDRLWVNNVDVCSVAKLYRLRPTQKARTYLRGLSDRLRLLLRNGRSSARDHGTHARVQRVLDEVANALEILPADGAGYLLSGRRSAQ